MPSSSSNPDEKKKPNSLAAKVARGVKASNENWIQEESEVAQFDPEKIAEQARSQVADQVVGKVLFGTYKVEKVLGEGAMGIVYLAKHLAFDRYVAMKTIKTNDEAISNRFTQEVKVHAKLKHDNIVEAIDCLVAPNNQTFFVMEYLEGVELEELVKTEELKTRPLDLADIIQQTCDALDFAHQKGVVHRDLKPGNIILTERDGKFVVKVVDFGIAKIQEDIQKLTKTGQALGSPLYMSPEQCMGNDIDGRADIYSLGILAYEAVTGELPYLGKDLVETMKQHCDPDFHHLPVAQHVPDFPCVEQFDSIINKALSTFPRHRYQDCMEFKKAVAFWVDSVKKNNPERQVPGTSRRVGKATSVPLETRKEEAEDAVARAAANMAPAPSPAPLPTRQVQQPGLPTKEKKVNPLGPMLLIGIVGGLVITVAILITALFFMKEKVNDLKAPQAVPAPVQQTAPVQSNPAQTAPPQTANPVETVKPAAVSKPKPVAKPKLQPKPKPKPKSKPRSKVQPKPKPKRVSKPKPKAQPKPKPASGGSNPFERLKRQRGN